MRRIIELIVLFVLIWGFTQVAVGADVDANRLVDAIRRAENSQTHPYGILTRYKHTTARQACLNSIISAKRRFAGQDKEKDFVVFLSKTYCPLNAANDPKRLNKNWVRNVRWFYERK